MVRQYRGQTADLPNGVQRYPRQLEARMAVQPPALQTAEGHD